MAIFTPGIAVGQISGRVGGQVFSHNKGGMYIRNGSIPSISGSAKASEFKSYLGLASQGYANLTDAQAAAWREYAANHPVTNRLGRSHTLSPNNWCVGCNARLLAAGDAPILLPPSTPAPEGVLINAASVAVTGPAATITLGTTPTGANSRVWIRAARVASGRITNVRNKLTTILITDPAETSPIDVQSELEADLGSFQEGDWYHFEVRIMDDRTGLTSAASVFSVETAA